MLNRFWRKRRPAPLGHRRLVNIDGNIFSFRMPENFSRDLPAYDLVDQIDTQALGATSPNVHLGRRWWDLRADGVFGRELGTLMLNMEVKILPLDDELNVHDQPLDVRSRFHFLTLLHQQLGEQYQPTSEVDAEHGYFLPLLALRSGDEWLTTYYDDILHNQVWTCFGIAQGDNTLIEGYALPVHERAYLFISFTHAANDTIAALALQQYSVPLARLISDTFRVEYTASNVIAREVEQAWHSMSPQQAIIANAQFVSWEVQRKGKGLAKHITSPR